MNVDFPQPDGPISAVTQFLRMSSDTSLMARNAPYETSRCSALSLTFCETDGRLGIGHVHGPRSFVAELAPYASRLMRMIGKRIVKVVPRPRVDSAEIAPPCASTIPLTIANPSPAPPLSRRRDRSTT